MPPQDLFYDRFRKISEPEKVLDRLYEIYGTLSRAEFEFGKNSEKEGISYYLNMGGQYSGQLPSHMGAVIEATKNPIKNNRSHSDIMKGIDRDLGAIHVNRTEKEFSFVIEKTPTSHQLDAIKSLSEAAELTNRSFNFEVVVRKSKPTGYDRILSGVSFRELKEKLPNLKSSVWHEIDLKTRTKELGIVPYKPNNLQIQREATSLKVRNQYRQLQKAGLGDWRNSPAMPKAQLALPAPKKGISKVIRDISEKGRGMKKAFLEEEGNLVFKMLTRIR